MKKHKTLKAKVTWIEEIDSKRKSYSSITDQGQLIVTELEDKILIQGYKVEQGYFNNSEFFITKDGASILIDFLKRILDKKTEK